MSTEHIGRYSKRKGSHRVQIDDGKRVTIPNRLRKIELTEGGVVVVALDDDGTVTSVRPAAADEVGQHEPEQPRGTKPDQPSGKANRETRYTNHLEGRSGGFVNPYTFVPLAADPPARKAPAGHERYDPDLLSGWFDAELTNESAMFSADAQASADAGLDPRDLMALRVDGHYAIAGASLKGMVRSMYEAITGSCLRIVDLDRLLSRRETGDIREFARKNAFLVTDINRESGDLQLQPATSYRLRVQPGDSSNNLSAYVDGDKVRFSVLTGATAHEDGEGQLDATGANTGVLKFADRGGGRRVHQRVVLPDPKRAAFTCTDGRDLILDYDRAIDVPAQEDTTRLEDRNVSSALDAIAKGPALVSREKHGAKVEVLVCDRRNDAGPDHTWGWREPRHKLRKGDVVWGDVDGGSPQSVDRLAPSQAYRVGFAHNAGTATPKDYLPCRDHDKLCPACRVFGMVAGDGTRDAPAYAGHVRPGWATGPLAPAVAPAQFTQLPPLLSPKPSHGPFYLLPHEAQPGADEPGASTNPDNTGGSWEDRSPEPEIAGRKVYWHQSPAGPIAAGNGGEQANVSSRVETLAPGTTFRFRIRFDNLTFAEVGLLAMSCDPRLISDDFGQARTKIGMGKPVGLGTVRVDIREFVVVDRHHRYSGLDDQYAESSSLGDVVSDAQQWIRSQWPEADPPVHLGALARVLDPTTTNGRQVHYPGLDWFTEHRKEALLQPEQVASGLGQAGPGS